jgi:predicted nucleic acid-binding protein
VKFALDANVLIYAIEPDSSLYDWAVSIFQDAYKKGYELHISELAYLEVLARPALSDKEAREFYEIVRNMATVNWPVDINILLRAAGLRRKYVSLKTPDAIHLATAIERNCDYFVTNDEALLKLKLSGIAVIRPAEVGKVAPQR